MRSIEPRICNCTSGNLGILRRAIAHLRSGARPTVPAINLLVEAALIKTTIHSHPQFAAFIAGLEAHFKKWHIAAAVSLRKLKQYCLPKEVIREHDGAVGDHRRCCLQN